MSGIFHVIPTLIYGFPMKLPQSQYVLAASAEKKQSLPLSRFLRSMAAQMVGRMTGLGFDHGKEIGAFGGLQGVLVCYTQAQYPLGMTDIAMENGLK